MNSKSFKRTFPSEVNLVKGILKEIMNYLSHSFPDISLEDYFDCKLIYNELLINAVVHGNENNKNKSVSVDIEILNKDMISSTITDQGNGFDYDDLIKEIENKDRLLLERGRGIQLVQSLTDELHYESCRKQIHFLKRMNQNGQNISCR